MLACVFIQHGRTKMFDRLAIGEWFSKFTWESEISTVCRVYQTSLENNRFPEIFPKKSRNQKWKSFVEKLRKRHAIVLVLKQPSLHQLQKGKETINRWNERRFTLISLKYFTMSFQSVYHSSVITDHRGMFVDHVLATFMKTGQLKFTVSLLTTTWMSWFSSVFLAKTTSCSQ